MKIKINKKSVFEKMEDYTSTDILFFKTFEIPIFVANEDTINQITNNEKDANGNIVIDCDDDKFIEALNLHKINYTILEE